MAERRASPLIHFPENPQRRAALAIEAGEPGRTSVALVGPPIVGTTDARTHVVTSLAETRGPMGQASM